MCKVFLLNVQMCDLIVELESPRIVHYIEEIGCNGDQLTRIAGSLLFFWMN